MTRRKFITRIALCLLLGLISTVAVAWGFAAWGSVGPEMTASAPRKFVVPDERLFVVVYEAHGLVGVERESLWVPRLINPLRSTPPPDQWLPIDTSWGLSDQDRISRSNARTFDSTREWAFGIPVPALWTYEDEHMDGTITRAGIPLPLTWGGETMLSTVPPHALPVLPIWRGLLLDTGFFAAIWAIPMFGVPLVRARRRRKRGLCPKCAYDLGGDPASGCPECGWGRPLVVASQGSKSVIRA